MDKKQVRKIIKIYSQDLAKQVKIDSVILFGSSLRGKIGINSDIDLLVLSRSFENINEADRFDILYSARKNIMTQKVPMDIFGMTPQEYAEASPLAATEEIKKTGEKIIL